jgi:hypothetical protein
MNTKRLVLATLGAFVVYFVLEMVLHGMLLAGIYAQTVSTWRPEAQMHSLMWLLWVMYLVKAFVLTLIYQQGYDPGKGGVGQGLRFGVYLGVLLATLQSIGISRSRFRLRSRPIYSPANSLSPW